MPDESIQPRIITPESPADKNSIMRNTNIHIDYTIEKQEKSTASITAAGTHKNVYVLLASQWPSMGYRYEKKPKKFMQVANSNNISLGKSEKRWSKPKSGIKAREKPEQNIRNNDEYLNILYADLVFLIKAVNCLTALFTQTTLKTLIVMITEVNP